MDFRQKIEQLKAQPASHWIATANNQFPAAISVLLAIGIAWYSARMLWVFVPLENEFDWNSNPSFTGANVSTPSSSAVDWQTIINAHLFGVAGADPTPVATIDAPETRLNLKLRGTIAAGDENLAHAIIADGNGKDEVFFIKDSLPGGAVLHEVYPDRVILNRAGVLETLRLPRLSESLGKQPTSARSRPEASQPSGSMASMMQRGPASFTDVLRPQPYMPNGELQGYRVYPGRDRRKFAALGLRPGDLVTDINGQPLNNLQSGMEVFKNLGDATQLTVTIERNGSPMQLTLDSDVFLDDDGPQQ
ncbi:MAG: type II secretion system protein GspC [Gammaproteobacteria bacterium]|jgi:general secretion pathway protein C